MVLKTIAVGTGQLHYLKQPCAKATQCCGILPEKQQVQIIKPDNQS